MTANPYNFIGNPDAYAIQNKDGSYTPVRSQLDAGLLADHIAGVTTLGTYVVHYDKARFFVFDIDDHDLLMAKQLAEECSKRGLHAGIEFSGRKGFHVWVLFDQWVSAADMQRLAKDIAATVGFNGEVFPKQGAARDLGSLIKLPLGKHAVTGNKSRFLMEPQVNPITRFVTEFDKLPAPAPATRNRLGQKCIDSIQDDPPKPGTRNDLYFHFACFMRRNGLHDEAIRAVLEELWLDPDPGEIDSVVANSEFSGPRCDSVPADRHCGAECIKQKAKGLSVRAGQLKHAMPGELIVVRVGGKLSPSDKVVNIEHDDAEAIVAKLRSDGN